MTQISQARCLELIEAIATEIFFPGHHPNYQNWLAAFAVKNDILGLTGQQQAILVVAMQTWLWQSENHQRFPSYERFPEEGMRYGTNSVYFAMMQLLRQKLPFSGEDIKTLCVQFCTADYVYSFSWPPELPQAIERYLQENPLTEDLQHYRVLIRVIASMPLQSERYCNLKPERWPLLSLGRRGPILPCERLRLYQRQNMRLGYNWCWPAQLLPVANLLQSG
jgi:hypothetical protein